MSGEYIPKYEIPFTGVCAKCGESLVDLNCGSSIRRIPFCIKCGEKRDAKDIKTLTQQIQDTTIKAQLWGVSIFMVLGVCLLIYTLVNYLFG
jgi:hypothetical protein